MDKTRRCLMSAAAAGSLLWPAVFARAQQGAWPSKPVKIVSPYGAGGPNDISARMFGEYLARPLGQQFIVENKAGAGTRIGNDAVAHASGDGYTILYAAAPYSTLEALYGKLTYDPKKDLQPVSMAATVPLFLVVNAETKATSAKELAALGRTKSGGLTFGAPGNGSQPHLAAELWLRQAKVEGLTVQYRGDAMAYLDLLAGRLDATLTAITAALPHIKTGKLRVLGVASETRSEIYPDAPTLKEQGFPSVVATGWYGFMAPASVTRDIVGRLEAQIGKAIADPEMRQAHLAQGMELRAGGASEFGRFIDAETAKWTKVIQEAGIKGE